MKFRDPKTGEVFEDVFDARERFCAGKACHTCVMPNVCRENLPLDSSNCADFTEKHPAEAARLMGYEVALKEEEAMENTKRPHICEVLGVEAGERFRVESDDCCLYPEAYVDDDEIVRASVGYAMDGMRLCQIIKGELRIIRKPRFSEEEIIAIRLIGGSYLARDMGGALSVWNSRPEWENGAWSYVMDWEERACGLPGHLFPGIKNGECVNIEEYTFA